MSDVKDLAINPVNVQIDIGDMDKLARFAGMLASSNLFTNVGSAAAIGTKIIAGAALGLDPITSINQLHLVQNRVTVGSGIWALAIKRSPKYDYQIVTCTDQECTIAFFEYIDGKRTEVGKAGFTMAEAKAAGLAGKPVWKSYPSDMLFSRALSRGGRRYAPDALKAPGVYVHGELGDNGEPAYVPDSYEEIVVDVESTPVDDDVPDYDPETGEILEVEEG